MFSCQHAALLPVHTMFFQERYLCYETKEATDFAVKDQDLLASYLQHQSEIFRVSLPTCTDRGAFSHRIEGFNKSLSGLLPAASAQY